jgi:hypothetical protein
MGTKALSDFSRSVVFEYEAADLALCVYALVLLIFARLFVFRGASCLVPAFSGAD